MASPLLRLLWDIPLAQRPTGRPQGVLPEGGTGSRDLVAPRMAVDLELAAATGAASSQDIEPGDFLAFKKVHAEGPARVRSTWEVYSVTASGRAGMWFSELLGVEGIVGLAGDSLDLRVESGSSADIEQTFHLGPLLGGPLTVRPFWWLDLYVQGAGGWLAGPQGLTHATGEAALVFRPWVPGLELIGGWRSWHLYASRGHTAAIADMDLEFSGPLLGLQVSF